MQMVKKLSQEEETEIETLFFNPSQIQPQKILIFPQIFFIEITL